MTKQKLPEGWKEVELGEVCKLMGGFAFKSSEFVDGGIPIVRISNFNNNNVDLSDAVYYPEKSKEKYSEYLLHDKDILIAMSGATTGKIGAVNKEDLPCLLNQRVGKFLIRDTNILLRDYLFFFVKSPTFLEFIRTKAFGCAQPNISSKNIESIKILLPPLPIQKKIVEKLERAEKIKQKREEADELAKEYLQSVFYEMFIKEKWQLVELKTVSKQITRGKSPKYVEKSNIRIINQKCIYWDGFAMENVKFLDEKVDLNPDFLLKNNDILITSTGTGTLGRAAVFKSITNQKITFDSHVTLIRSNKELDPAYFCFFLQTEYGQKRLYAECVTGSTNQIELSKSTLEKFQIPLPPISLQQEFSKIVENVEKIKEKQKQSEKHINELFESLMQKAFSGELV